jgi:protein phosphatase
MKIRIGSKIDVGKVRDHQEDDMLIAPDALNSVWEHDIRQYYDINEKLTLLAIADGMGGMNAGEVASAIAISSLQSFFSKLEPAACHPQNLPDLLTNAIEQAHQEILSRGGSSPDEAGMGATIVAVALHQGFATVSWVGDSRGYLKRNGEPLRQLTKDHSLVQDLIDKGALSKAQAAFHPQRNVILQSLGSHRALSPDVIQIKVHEEDILLLCSDGLNGMISDSEIEEILALSNEPQQCAANLLKAALIAGGHDNISVIVAALEPLEQSLPSLAKVQARKQPKTVTPQTGISNTAVLISLVAFCLIALFSAVLIFSTDATYPIAPAPTKNPGAANVLSFPEQASQSHPGTGLDTFPAPSSPRWHSEDFYVIRVNVFAQKKNAVDYRKRIQDLYPSNQVEVRPAGDLFEVIIAQFQDRNEAEAFKASHPELKESIIYRQKNRK